MAEGLSNDRAMLLNRATFRPRVRRMSEWRWTGVRKVESALSGVRDTSAKRIATEVRGRPRDLVVDATRPSRRSEPSRVGTTKKTTEERTT